MRASSRDGNVGLLSEDYAGDFPVGDAAALAALLERVRDDADALPTLEQTCDGRAALFDPAAEAAALASGCAAALTPPGGPEPVLRQR